MNIQSFTTVSGRRVYFEQLHVRTSSLGFVEGSATSIRSEVLRRLPAEVRDTYGKMGLLLREPAPGHLPVYMFFVQLLSTEPVNPGADASSLVVVWFSDTLPDNLPAELLAQIQSIEWEKHAKDGSY